jgi:hypothetical protein
MIFTSENQNIFSQWAGQGGQINAMARKVICPSGSHIAVARDGIADDSPSPARQRNS